jgi:ABC-type multidrug transport system ATPase subunit
VRRPADRVASLVSELGLDAVADRPMGGYSQGERRRVGLAGALVHDPTLLLLDEPSSGLDGAGAHRLVDLIERRRDAGAVVAVTTHDPWLAAELGGRLLALGRGSLRRDEAAPESESAWRELFAEEDPAP